MSNQTRLHMLMLKRRGVPDADPRIQGLQRRIERDKEIEDRAKELCKEMQDKAKQP